MNKVYYCLTCGEDFADSRERAVAHRQRTGHTIKMDYEHYNRGWAIVFAILLILISYAAVSR